MGMQMMEALLKLQSRLSLVDSAFGTGVQRREGLSLAGVLQFMAKFDGRPARSCKMSSSRRELSDKAE